MRRVYVDFEDHALADRFFDALASWLSEDVPWDASKSPIVYKPRHFFWADADVCAENVSPDTNSATDENRGSE